MDDEEVTMESVGHSQLRPYSRLNYTPEAEVRRGLRSYDIVIDDRIRDDVDDFAAPYFEQMENAPPERRGWPGPETWGEITHIGLSRNGDIRMININESGATVERDQTLPTWFEVYVIPSEHPRYRLALARVMALLPELQAGAGMVRLIPPLQAPWPFFDYDFANDFYHLSLEELAEEEPKDRTEALDGDCTLPNDVMAVSLGHDRVISLAPGLSNVVLEVQPRHARYADILAEVRRTLPDIQRGAGFANVEFTAPPPWPCVPLERAVDESIARRIAEGSWYTRPFDPPPPPMPAPRPDGQRGM